MPGFHKWRTLDVLTMNTCDQFIRGACRPVCFCQDPGDCASFPCIPGPGKQGFQLGSEQPGCSLFEAMTA